MDLTICTECMAAVPVRMEEAHMRWHELEENLKLLVNTYQASLVERMYAAEKQIEALVARVYFVERGRMGLPPTGDPQGHHHQVE
jgi:hypothetical protein